MTPDILDQTLVDSDSIPAAASVSTAALATAPSSVTKTYKAILFFVIVAFSFHTWAYLCKKKLCVYLVCDGFICTLISIVNKFIAIHGAALAALLAAYFAYHAATEETREQKRLRKEQEESKRRDYHFSLNLSMKDLLEEVERYESKINNETQASKDTKGTYKVDEFQVPYLLEQAQWKDWMLLGNNDASNALHKICKSISKHNKNYQFQKDCEKKGGSPISANQLGNLDLKNNISELIDNIKIIINISEQNQAF